MKRNHTQTFTRPDGTKVICATDANGQRLPTRYVRPDGTEAKPPAPPAKKPPRRIEAKRTNAPAQRPAKPALVRNDCLHIIEATEESVEQENCGCVGNKMTSVWTCELFGRVAPFAKGDPTGGVRACQKCGKYEKALPPAPPGE